MVGYKDSCESTKNYRQTVCVQTEVGCESTQNYRQHSLCKQAWPVFIENKGQLQALDLSMRNIIRAMWILSLHGPLVC